MDDLQGRLRRIGQGDAHRHLRGRLHGLAAGDDVDVKESRKFDVLRVGLQQPGGLGQIFLIVGRALLDLADPKLRALGNPGAAAVGHRHVIGAAVGGQDLL